MGTENQENLRARRYSDRSRRVATSRLAPHPAHPVGRSATSNNSARLILGRRHEQHLLSLRTTALPPPTSRPGNVILTSSTGVTISSPRMSTHDTRTSSATTAQPNSSIILRCTIPNLQTLLADPRYFPENVYSLGGSSRETLGRAPLDWLVAIYTIRYTICSCTRHALCGFTIEAVVSDEVGAAEVRRQHART